MGGRGVGVKKSVTERTELLVQNSVLSRVEEWLVAFGRATRESRRFAGWLPWLLGFGMVVAAAFGFDAELAAWFKGAEAGYAKKLSTGISRYGDFPMLLLLGGMGLWVGVRSGRRRWVRVIRWMLVACVAAGVVANVGRYVCGRARPIAKVAPGWYGPAAAFRGMGAHKFHSFPSAHTACVSGFLFPLVILGLRRRGWLRGVAVLAVAGILAMGWARMHLRVHHLSDVLAGAWVGAVSAVVVCSWPARRGVKKKLF